MAEGKWFQRGYRRMLVDMHIPDWDPAFLSKFDPAEMVRLYKVAGLTSVMFYAQSHVGLCNWPTRSGKMHEGLRGRDIVAETLKHLREAEMGACGYYSVVYNNWAYLERPEWRMVPADRQDEKKSGASGAEFSGTRYGVCCPNNSEYRQFVRDQLNELAGGYRMDGLFIDMTFWPRICVCEHCRSKYESESGKAIPQTIDWFSPDWCQFQSARERWIIEFADEINRTAKSAADGELSVYHNFATAAFNWTLGLSLEAASANDFLGADFYGDQLEQLVVSKLMNNLSANRPMEFMTSRCITLNDHEANKSPDLIRMQALGSTLFSGAMLFIDAINPDGTANAGTYEMIREVYDEMSQYEPFLGGEAVEDVAIYYSSDSKVDFAENGSPMSEARLWGSDYPHKRAVRGASQALQQAHIPFGIITRKQLDELDRYKVVILPNVLRMDEREVAAFRGYVERGGRLYGSRFTSLTETVGRRHNDCMLADVFGCHVAADDVGSVVYLKPRDERVVSALSPQDYMSCLRPRTTPGSPPVGNQWNGSLQLAERVEGQVLATLSLPYDQNLGTVHDQTWSSIHSNPPWCDTGSPVLVEHSFGGGRTIYSAIDIESTDGAANQKLFVKLITDLLEGRQSASADAHPCVWMTVTGQDDRQRMIVALLNYQTQLPPVPLREVRFSLRPPAGRKFARLRLLPAGGELDFVTDDNGQLRATVPQLEALAMLSAEYE